MIRHSQLQREVLRLYRAFLRACEGKPSETRDHVRRVFRENASSVGRANVLYTEYLVRRGRRQLRMLQTSDGITKLG